MEGQGRRLQGRVGSLQLDAMRHENKNLADRSRIFSTGLATVASPSTSWTSKGGGSRSRRWSSREQQEEAGGAPEQEKNNVLRAFLEIDRRDC